MVSLKSVGLRNEIPFTVIAGGSGVIRGEITEADQKQIPVYAFVNPRHVLRTHGPSALQLGMVIRSPEGVIYIVGENGPSEQPQGTLWQSWRLFEATGQRMWTRRGKVIDPVTQMEREGAEIEMGMIWVALEPLEREQNDFRMSASFEQSRLITGADVTHDDLVGGRKVTRAEKVLGVTIGVVS